jgi:DNA invertase Pin-like site-specific DNA recombinase
MRLLSYARLSADDPPGAERIPDQHRDNRAWIEARGDTCVGEYSDNLSGVYDERHRAGLAAVLDALRSGRADGAVARDLDRWARNADLHGHLWTLFRQLDATLLCRLDDTASRDTRRARAAAGEDYRERVRVNCIRRFKQRAEARQYPGGRSCFGTRWVRSVSDSEALQLRLRRQPIPYHRIIIPSEAEMLRHVVARLEAGDSLRAASVAAGLREKRLGDAVRNPAIAGGYRYGATRTLPDSPRRVRTGATPLIHWDAHEAIIPRERWEALQAILDARGWPENRPPRNSRPLTGLLRCGVCGGTVSVYTLVHRPRRDYRYARCYRRHCVHAEIELWPGQILARVMEYLASAETARALSRLLATAHAQGRQAGIDEAEIARLDRAERAILDLAGDGTIDAAEARRRLAPIRAQRDALRRAERRDQTAARWMTPDQIHEVLTRAADALRAGAGDPAMLRGRLHQALEAVRVLGPGEADLVLRLGVVLHTGDARTDSSVRPSLVLPPIRWRAAA